MNKLQCCSDCVIPKISFQKGVLAYAYTGVVLLTRNGEMRGRREIY